MKAFRKQLAAILTDWVQFIQRHPAVSLAGAAALLFACSGLIYLILANFHSLMDLSCFVSGGGCGH